MLKDVAPTVLAFEIIVRDYKYFVPNGTASYWTTNRQSQIKNLECFQMDGVLIIDKPAGMTSHDVVARVRKMIGERRIGHTGTLDPFATGVLVLLVGRATRIAQFLSAAEKEYEAVIRFGYSTDTGDVTGTHAQTGSHAKAQSTQSLRKEQIESAIAALVGEIEQLPPMYSAKKIAGRKLYELARLGEEVEREPVPVTIHEFELLTDAARFSPKNDGSLDIRVRVVCSAGTYIRTLAEDLGTKLGIGAHLAELRRTRAGQFQIGAALTLEELGDASENKLADAFISPHAALSHLPSIELDDEQLRRTSHGLALPLTDHDLTFRDGEPIRLTQVNQLIAVGKFDAQQRTVRPSVVLGTP